MENHVASSVQEQSAPVPQQEQINKRYRDARFGSAILLARLMKHHPKEMPASLRGLAQIIQIPTEENIIAMRGGYPSVRDIIAETASYYRVRFLDVISGRRTKELVLPRHMAMWLCRELTPLSLPVIGRHFANRDHTTILNGIRQIERKRKFVDRLQDDIDVIRLHILDRMQEAA